MRNVSTPGHILALSNGFKKSPFPGIDFAEALSFPSRELHDAFLEARSPSGARAKATVLIDKYGQVLLKDGVDPKGLFRPQELGGLQDDSSEG